MGRLGYLPTAQRQKMAFQGSFGDKTPIPCFHPEKGKGLETMILILMFDTDV